MKILVDADRLHEVIMKAVDLKHQFENNSKLYEMASYITGNLSSMWFNGTQEVEQASIRATQGISASLNDTMKRLEKAANNWKPSPEGHITNEDREWADREIEKHRADNTNKPVSYEEWIETQSDKKPRSLGDVLRASVSNEIELLELKQTVVDILDMLEEYAPYEPIANIGIRRDYKLGLRVKTLKAKLVGEK